MAMMQALALLLLTSIGINLVLFVIAFRQQTDKLTDASYAISFIALTIAALLYGDVSPVKLLFAGMVTLWALRLGSFLLVRIRHMQRDARFDDKRGSVVKFGGFWLAQAITAWVMLLPISFVLLGDYQSIAVVSIIGVGIWLAGLVCEAVADWQKYRFNSVPAHKGTWIDIGLWQYSRHPNYFGEILVWVGVYIAALPYLTGWQVWAALASPLLIEILLIKVSGIPILEKAADERWGKMAAYRDYKARTSILIPMPKK